MNGTPPYRQWKSERKFVPSDLGRVSLAMRGSQTWRGRMKVFDPGIIELAQRPPWSSFSSTTMSTVCMNKLKKT